MARKVDGSGKTVTVSVVGLSGTEKEKGQLGIGKSCFCNRFIRSLADDYNVDHISVLSQTDFSGRVVNNDHFLYWGGATKELDDQELHFQIVEQTEFVDDACFQPFKGSKMEPYVKRCSATKLQSAEKLMYICKNQLGIEKEYEQRVMPDGKLSIDGFLCVYDVSQVPGRSFEKQSEFVFNILLNIVKTKKPVVLVTSKNDEASEQGIREAERLVQRKEFKGSIPIVETSSHDSVNVDQAFLLLAQLIDKTKTRLKVANYVDALRVRRDKLDFVTEAFTQLIRSHVKEHRELWSATNKRLCHHPEWIRFVEQFGNDGTQVVFRRHTRRLKEERYAKRLRRHLARLPSTLHWLQLNTDDMLETDWPSVVQQIRSHRDFPMYFVEGGVGGGLGGSDCDSADEAMPIDATLPLGERGRGSQTIAANQQRIPVDVLETNEAAEVFVTFLREVQEEQRTMEWRAAFKRLLEDTGMVTPGKALSEVRVLFMGRECFEALSEQQQRAVYDTHQRQITANAKHNFQELLLEHADLFYHFKTVSPSGTITQDDIKEITDVLQDDFRYKMLDRMDQDRKLMLFQHLGFVHCPFREHCPAATLPSPGSPAAAVGCIDTIVEDLLNRRIGTLTTTNQGNVTGAPTASWAVTADSTQLDIVLIGMDTLAEDFAKKINYHCDSDGRFPIDGKAYTINCKLAGSDPADMDALFAMTGFSPNGCFCIYSNQESFEFLRECVEKTLLTNLEQEDKLPFQGLPIIILFIQDDSMDKKEMMRLQEEGQSLSDNLHSPYIDVSSAEISHEAFISDALHELMRCASGSNLYRNLIVCFDSDIRVIMCLFCGDPYNPETILNPLLIHQTCFLTGDRSLMIETFLGDSKRKIEVIISSYHGANQFRDELIHGFILVYSVKRKASLATLNAFSGNIPNLPIQMVAVTSGATQGSAGAAAAFFQTDVGQALLTDGNAAADMLGAHFTTYSSSCENKSAFYTPFFKEVWEKKPEIERAFNMEEDRSVVGGGVNLPDVAGIRRHPHPPPRNDSYHVNNTMDPKNYKLTSSLDLLIGPEGRLSQCDFDTEYNDKINNSKNRGFLKGFSVYPPPSTPPEPAPPDHRLHHPDLSPDLNCSEESLSTHDSDGGSWQPLSYGARAFTTGRPRHQPPPHPPHRHSHTLKQPGKLDMNNYTKVTDTLQHITITGTHSGRDRKSHRSGGHHESGKSTFGHHHHHHPSGVSSETELDVQYAQINEYGRDASGAGRRTRHRRHLDKQQPPSFSETDSECSSESAEGVAGAGGVAMLTGRRRHAPHHYHPPPTQPPPPPPGKAKGQQRGYKKRGAVAVQSPRVPKLGVFVGPPELPSGYRPRPPGHHDKRRGGSDSSDASESGHGPNTENTGLISGATMAAAGDYPSSAQDNDSSSTAGGGGMMAGVAARRTRHHTTHQASWTSNTQSNKSDRRNHKWSKSSSKDSKKNSSQSSNTSVGSQNCGPQGTNGIPIFLEKCVEFIEQEGLSSEGIYRVPGNRAHVDLLLKKFDEDPYLNIPNLDIPVNAVATALKEFFSKRLPPIFDEASMAELEDIAGACPVVGGGVELRDRSGRLLALRALLGRSLAAPAHAALRYIIGHFVRIAENSKLNSMDSKNLAICWWPTLLPVQFTDMARFEMMRPYLEDILQTMIDQYPFLFCGQEAFVMV